MLGLRYDTEQYLKSCLDYGFVTIKLKESNYSYAANSYLAYAYGNGKWGHAKNKKDLERMKVLKINWALEQNEIYIKDNYLIHFNHEIKKLQELIFDNLVNQKNDYIIRFEAYKKSEKLKVHDDYYEFTGSFETYTNVVKGL